MPNIQFQRNPLINVVCQVRFPPILTISEALPVKFQEELRHQYPQFKTSIEQQFHFNFEQDKSGSLLTPAIDQTDTAKNYHFASADSVWAVNLTNTFLAVSTSNYSTWEEFKDRVQTIVTVFNRLYSPAFFERVGLRYINAIQRTKLGVSPDIQWTEFIHPFALGFLSDDVMRDKISGFNSTTEINNDSGIMTRIVTALGQVKNSANTEQYAPEISFIIDTDSFFGKIVNVNDGLALDRLHQAATEAFQFIITEKLCEVMEPMPI